jgi:HSP20 family protein
MSLIQSLIPSLSRSPSTENRAPSAPADRPFYQLKENDDAYGLTVYLPGVAKDGVTITDEAGVLTVRGERQWKAPESWTALYRESTGRAFEFSLQHENAIDIDKIHAELNDGVLRVSLPKAESRKPRKITLS